MFYSREIKTEILDKTTYCRKYDRYFIDIQIGCFACTLSRLNNTISYIELFLKATIRLTLKCRFNDSDLDIHT